MEETQIKQISPMAQLIFIMLLSICSGMLFSFLGTEVVHMLYGINLFEGDLALLNDPYFEHTRSLNLILIFCQHLGAFILPAFIFQQRMLRLDVSFFEFEKPNKKIIWIAVAAMLASIPTVGMLAGWNESLTLPEGMKELENTLRALEESAQQITEAVLATTSLGGLILNIALIALIPALGEELLFRGIIQRIFSKWTNNYHIGIWLSAALFSALHMQFFGFIPRFLLGGMLGYLFVFSGNIWVPIAAHFANNAIAIIFTYMIHNKVISESWGIYGSRAEDWFGVCLSMFLTGACLWYLYKYKLNQQTKEL
jgi:membrane protease YdiL (CAAX protease family)